MTRESDPEGSKTGAGSGAFSRGNGSSQPRSAFTFSRTSLGMIRCANGSFEDVNALNSQTKEAEMPESNVPSLVALFKILGLVAPALVSTLKLQLRQFLLQPF